MMHINIPYYNGIYESKEARLEINKYNCRYKKNLIIEAKKQKLAFAKRIVMGIGK